MVRSGVGGSPGTNNRLSPTPPRWPVSTGSRVRFRTSKPHSRTPTWKISTRPCRPGRAGDSGDAGVGTLAGDASPGAGLGCSQAAWCVCGRWVRLGSGIHLFIFLQ